MKESIHDSDKLVKVPWKRSLGFFFFFFFGGTVIFTDGFVLAKQGLDHLRHTSSPSYSGYFGDGISTIYPVWPQTASSFSQPPE
jgi:hypothetical protein